MSVSALSDELLATTLAAHEEQLAALRAEHAALTERISQTYAQFEALRNEQAERRIRSMPTPDWAWLLTAEGGSAHYKACDKELGKLGLQTGGYFPETNQSCLQISIGKSGANIPQVLAGLEQVLPAILPVDGAKRLRILDDGLSQYAAHWLYLSESGEASVVEYRYGHETVLHTAEALQGALEFVRKHCPYGA